MEHSLKGRILSTLLAATLVTGLSPMTALAIQETVGGGGLTAGQLADQATADNADANTQDEAATADELAASTAKGLATQSYDAEPWNGGSFESNLYPEDAIPVETDSEGVFFRIQPSETALYKIYSEGADDTYATLYDADGEFISYDDDSGENLNFKITQRLEESETYYVLVRGLGGDASFTLCLEVTDAYDFSNCYVNLYNYYVIYQEGAICIPEFSTDVPEDGYTACVKQWDYDADAYVDVTEQEIGNWYKLFLEPVDPYHGDALTADFQVISPTDLVAAEVEIETLEAMDPPEVVYPEVTVVLNGNELTEGVDYELSWSYYDYDKGERVDVDGPSELDTWYTVTITGKDGTDYENTSTSRDYRLSEHFDQYDLVANGNPWVSGTIFVGGSTEDLETGLEVHDLEWNWFDLSEGEDYTVAGFERWTGTESPWGEDADGEWVAVDDFNVAGAYRVVFEGAGDYHGTVYARFPVYAENDLAAAEVEVSSRYVYGNGKASAPDVAVYFKGELLEEGTDYTVSFFDEGENVYTTDDQFSPGTWYGVLVTAAEDGNYTGQASGGFYVRDAYDLSNCWFELQNSTFAYTGDPIAPSVTATDALGKELTKGDDYQLVYRNADDDEELAGAPVDIGSYHVGIKGVEGSQYYGGENSWWWINIVDTNDLSSCSAYADPGSFAAGCMPNYFEIVVRPGTYDDDDEYPGPLQEGVDYKISGYERWTGAESPWDEDDDGEWEAAEFDGSTEGYYRAVIEGVEGGAYHGTACAYIEVYGANNLRDASVDIDNTVCEIGEAGVTPTVTVSLHGKKLTQGADYVVQYWEGEDECEETAEPPLSAGRYTIEIMPVDGSGYAGTYTLCFEVEDASDFSSAWITLWESVYRYTGNPVKLDIGGVCLRGESIDPENYELLYYAVDEDGDPVGDPLDGVPSAVGAYAIYVQGTNGYHGGFYGDQFKIVVANDIALADVQFEGLTVNGPKETLTPKATLTLDGKQLTEGDDYVVKYWLDGGEFTIPKAPPLGVASYQAEFTGTGSYSGTLQRWFSIRDHTDVYNLSYGTCREYCAYTGQPVKAPIDGLWDYYDDVEKELVEGADYEILYSEDEDADDSAWTTNAPSEVGRYYFKMHGINKYHGYTWVERYDIVPAKSFELASVKVEPWSYAYTGSEVTPKYTVVYDDGVNGPVTLMKDHDYTATIHSRVDAGYYEETVVPVEIGDYAIVIAPAEDSEYSYAQNGEGIWDEFRIVDSKNLWYGQIGDSDTPYETISYTGDVVQFEPAVYAVDGTALENGKDFTYQYVRFRGIGYDDVPYDSIDASVIKDEGDYGVRAVAKDGSGYEGKTDFRIFRITSNTPVVKTIDLSGAKVDVAAMNYVYTGKEQTTAVSVSLNGVTVPSSGYDVTYANNRDAGTATVTVTGKGNYTGTATGTFTIAKATLAMPAAKRGLVYTGKAQTGVAAGEGYAVTGNTGTNAGNYTATLKADANHVFAGGKATATVKWTIAKANTTLTLKAKSKKALAAKAKKKTTIKASKAFKVTNPSKGKLTYEKVKGNKKITVAKNGKITVKKGLKKGKTYTVKVKASCAATTNYNDAVSKTISLKIKVK